MSPRIFLRSLDELTKHTSLKQWDPFLNYRSWNLGTELIRKPNEPPLESVNGAKPEAGSLRLSTAGLSLVTVITLKS